MANSPRSHHVNRRRFLKQAAMGIGVASTGLMTVDRAFADTAPEDGFSFGLVTDVHFADVATAGSRHYRDSLDKLGRAVGEFNRRKLPMAVELGDFIDAGPSVEKDLQYLKTIRGVWERFSGSRHFVLGNHCVTALTKEQFLANCGTTVRRSYYSFDTGPFHFVVLDGNFRRDGVSYKPGNFSWTDTAIPPAQLGWLAEDLKAAGERKTIAFIHQNLDREKESVGVKNGPEVRAVLEKPGNVLAVFQGHHHAGGYHKIGGIHYYTLKAMVEGPGAENNAFAVVTIDATGGITVDGFGREADRRLE